jgi:hypothetical protein
MFRFPAIGRTVALAAALNVAAGLLPARAAADVPPAEADKPRHATLTLRGRVVWLEDALRRQFGIESDADVAHTQVALESADGQVYPIVKDARGRAFALDERIRGIDLELLVRRYENAPVVQVMKIYTLKDDGKYEFDYWCDVCAIPMYQLKPCECCQGEIRIRERRVTETGR